MDEAEQHYLKALELDPKEASAHGNYGNFLWEERHRGEEGEEHFRRALELEPEDAAVHLNRTELLVSLGRPGEARRELQWAWKRVFNDDGTERLRALLLAGLVLRLEGKTDEAILGRFATLFRTKFETDGGSYDVLLSALEARLSKEDFSLYSRLAAILTGKSKPEALNDFPRWQSVKPLPLEGALFDEVGDAEITLPRTL